MKLVKNWKQKVYILPHIAQQSNWGSVSETFGAPLEIMAHVQPLQTGFSRNEHSADSKKTCVIYADPSAAASVKVMDGVCIYTQSRSVPDFFVTGVEAWQSYTKIVVEAVV